MVSRHPCLVQGHLYLVLQVFEIDILIFIFSVKKVIERHGPCYDTCPGKWIGFGSKCFYFSEDMRNWTFSRTSCITLEAHLAQFESLEELDFLRTHMGPFNHWIGLHRESQEQPWRWTDNTEYNKIVLTRGEGECGYLSDIGISSARDYTHRKWICSKSNRSTVQCPEILNQGE
ncbi:C-type lectin domain family 2 member E-like [Microtus ochrogaster]|uniref:C-type lectin domain family 2 member E-like n=1 Tax=Microtus ochrogaster TaxID=79684 RepID=A0ABM0LMY1_MICOH|nr:C-type lectin domain family 2 member E-like [Microtus ochrogaster]